MNGNPYKSPDDASPLSTPKQPKKFSFFRVLVLTGIVALLGMLLLPLHRGGSREAARRMQCSNNLKNIALALHNYESAYGALPPAYTVDADGEPLHSWRTLILPYLDQQPLYETIDLSKPWNDPANLAACSTNLHVYCCPSADQPRNHTAYFCIVAPNSCFRPTEPRPLTEIPDHQGTLLVVEVDSEHAVPWSSPQDADKQIVMNRGRDAPLSHTGGMNAVFVDGSVRFLSTDISVGHLETLISIGGDDNEAYLFK